MSSSNEGPRRGAPQQPRGKAQAQAPSSAPSPSQASGYGSGSPAGAQSASPAGALSASPAGAPNVQAIRGRLGLSPQQFATQIGVSVETVEGWERRSAKPEGPAKALLAILEREPEAAKRALAQQGQSQGQSQGYAQAKSGPASD